MSKPKVSEPRGTDFEQYPELIIKSVNRGVSYVVIERKPDGKENVVAAFHRMNMLVDFIKRHMPDIARNY